jgi:primosomal protein N' (replication factor Y) (superfamily II helicase)
MSLYVQLAINVPSIAGVFDYSIPATLAGNIRVGHLVTVPFNKQIVQGVVLRFVEQPSVREVKEIIDLLDPEPVLTQAQISLAESLAESTLSSLAAMIDLFLPAGLSQQADMLYEIRETGIGNWKTSESAKSRTISPETQKLKVEDRILDLLVKRGPLRGRQIDRHFSQIEWRRSAQYLVKKGILSARSVLPPASVRPKFIRVAELAAAPDVAESALPTLGMKSTLERRQKALRFLMREKDAVNVSWVYAESGCNLADLQELAERELILLRETEIWRDPLEKVGRKVIDDAGELELTDEQQSAWQKIQDAFQSNKLLKPFLLHGVTGSGKTELYIRAAEETIRRGKQAIILVPEIALTPQTVRRFLSRFPGQMGLIHSKLSAGERYDTWRRARAGLLKVVIGPRSALFAPLPNIGLIVLDECHDGSYYQSEPPFYHAVTAAQTYARHTGALCLLGSATPSIVQRYQAEGGESVRLELMKRIPNVNLMGSASGMPPVSIIDMREELKAGSRGIFSRALLEGLESTLTRGEQAILFLNRRGTATYVFCRDCGFVAKCPRCDNPLTYHVTSGEKLLCHHCGYDRLMPKKCPECARTNIRAYGLGSEKVESEVQALFPKARVLRWDWETTREKDAHEIILSHFAAGRADVLVGTQMLAKGLDLPMVTLVGIVFAAVGLNMPDPFAAERVFQTLTQVAGRAGRSARGGQVILQTFAPGHYAIQAASQHDVNGFYQYELEQRKRLGYPPFARLVKLEYRHYDLVKAETEARKLAGKLDEWLKADDKRQTTLVGPVPCFHAKVNGQYRWQIVLRGPDLISVLRGRDLSGWRVETEPVSLL